MAEQRRCSWSSTFHALLFVSLTVHLSSGSRYTVGDSVWSIPPYPAYYSNWSSLHRFLPGDNLVFKFETGFYNVIQVSKLEYETCTAGNPFQAFNAGPATVVLIEKGVFYFVCSVSNYCSLGQKVRILVYPPLPKTPPTPAPSPGPIPGTAAPEPQTAPEPFAGGGSESQPPTAPEPFAGGGSESQPPTLHLTPTPSTSADRDPPPAATSSDCPAQFFNSTWISVGFTFILLEFWLMVFAHC